MSLMCVKLLERLPDIVLPHKSYESIFSNEATFASHVVCHNTAKHVLLINLMKQFFYIMIQSEILT